MSPKQENLITLALIALCLLLAVFNLSPRLIQRQVPLTRELPNISVSIAGAVRQPGVYELPWGATLQDLVGAAGGLRYDADEYLVNLAQPLDNGMSISIPFSVAAYGDKLLSLNEATGLELETLPGVGPAMAQRIIKARPFYRIEDLLKVQGIGEKTLENLRPYIRP
ncbi:MAG: ComEA family DNA-binding protein [Deinococcales bacterium]